MNLRQLDNSRQAIAQSISSAPVTSRRNQGSLISGGDVTTRITSVWRDISEIMVLV